MAFDTAPKDTIYSLPPEAISRPKLHYVAIQVTEYRYFVAEYAGGNDKGSMPLHFRKVSDNMTFIKAYKLIEELTAARSREGK